MTGEIMKALFIFVLALLLFVVCSDKNDTPNDSDKSKINDYSDAVPLIPPASGNFTCECNRIGGPESISANSPKEAETHCKAKGAGKIRSCKKP